MADRVHPTTDDVEPTTTTATSDNDNNPKNLSKPTTPAPAENPQGTYVIQIPKDTIYRVPPPENDQKYQSLTRRSKKRRNPCCCCLCWILGLLALLVVLAGIGAAVFYLVVRPEAPKYSVNSISVKGFNLSSSAISPEFDVTVRADNPNKKIGIYYEKKSSGDVYYSDVKLCNGALPVFYQPSKNVTVFETALKGSGIVLGSSVHGSLLTEQSNGKIPFKLKMKAPVKFKVGSVKTWTITVKVSCDITVDKLTAEAKILSNDCDFSVKPW